MPPSHYLNFFFAVREKGRLSEALAFGGKAEIAIMTSASEDFARSRGKALRLGIVTSVLSRGLAALAPLLVIPLSLDYLGASYYGAWATALSITAFALFADLGIGTGLMTRLGAISGDTTRTEEARIYVASAYATVSGVSIGLVCLLFLSPAVIDWGHVLAGTPSGSTGAISWIILATLLVHVTSIITSLIVRVQYAVGQQAASNTWQGAASLGMVIATWLAAQADPGPVIFVVLASSPPLLLGVVNTASFFTLSKKGRILRPKMRHLDLRVAGVLMRLGVRYLLIAMLMAGFTALDPWIIAQATDVANVPEYSIPLRLFSFVTTISVMLTLPLWPFHAESMARGDIGWVRRTTRKATLFTTAIVGTAVLLLVLIGPYLMAAWIDPSFPVNRILWGGLATWVFLQAFTSAAFMVQNAAEVLLPQTIGYAALLLALPVKWGMSATVGIEWIPWVSAGMFALIMLPACRAGYSRAVRQYLSREA